MNGRRGFLAIVGGVLVTGGVKAADTRRPTLLLPPRIGVPVPENANGLIDPCGATGYPLLDTYTSAGRSQMHAFVDTRGALPDHLFYDWLEGGLRMAEGCKPGGSIYRAMQMEGRA